MSEKEFLLHIREVIRRMTLSIQAHPDCEEHSEFWDMATSGWEQISEIDERINHLKQ